MTLPISTITREANKFVENALGEVAVRVSTEEILAKYVISDLDDASSTKYYGFVSSTGEWYIMKLTTTESRYVSGSSDYATNWTGRAGLTYQYFYEAF
jgi:hypothetical protein